MQYCTSTSICWTLSLAILSLCKSDYVQTPDSANDGAYANFLASQSNRPKASSNEALQRRLAFDNSTKFIKSFHSNKFTVGYNSLADEPLEFYRQRLGSAPITPQLVQALSSQTVSSATSQSAFGTLGSLDWRNANPAIVGPVRDQGYCGCCWAMATAQAIESSAALHSNSLIPISKEEFIDCSTATPNDGCSGGSYFVAFQYAVSFGATSEAAYPYSSSLLSSGHSTCKLSSNKPIVTNVTTFQYIGGVATAANLQSMISTYGPVAALLYAELSSFQYYTGGIYSDPLCSSSSGPDHAVLIVGYGVNSTTNTPYWIVKNSWGTGWGTAGYFMIESGVNMCWIEYYPAVPIANVIGATLTSSTSTTTHPTSTMTHPTLTTTHLTSTTKRPTSTSTSRTKTTTRFASTSSTTRQISTASTTKSANERDVAATPSPSPPPPSPPERTVQAGNNIHHSKSITIVVTSFCLLLWQTNK